MKFISTEQFIPFVKKWGVLILQIITLVVYQWLFYRQTGGTSIFTEGMGLMFTFAILISLLFSFFRTQWLYPVFLLLFIIQLYANILYYRTYYAFIPFSSYLIVGNLKEFDQAVIMLMKGKDLFLLLPFVIYLIANRLLLRNGIIPINHWKRSCVLVSSAILCTVLSLAALKGSGVSGRFFYENVEATRKSSFPVYFAFSIYEYVQHRTIDLTTEERHKIAAFIPDVPVKRTVASKNLILILIESLESWPVSSEVEGQPIMPFLNSLVNDENIWYNPYLLPQTHDGGSMDAQLILNTGLLPPRRGAFAFMYENNTYPSLSKILKANGYANTSIYQACRPTMWNQTKVNHAFGTEQFRDVSSYICTDLIGNALSDSSFLAQTAKMLTDLPEPFYAQLITQSSHTPFRLPENKKKLSLAADRFNETFADYLEAISYVDASLQNFFEKMKTEGLYDRSIFILTGDHCTSYGTGKLSDWLEPYRDSFHIKGNFVPLIIINGGVNGISEQMAAQIDVFPTLLDLLGINSKWNGLSSSLFAPGRKPSVCSVDDGFTVDSTEYDYCKEMAEISDLIIRGNYFKNTTVSKLPTDTGIITNVSVPD